MRRAGRRRVGGGLRIGTCHICSVRLALLLVIGQFERRIEAATAHVAGSLSSAGGSARPGLARSAFTISATGDRTSIARWYPLRSVVEASSDVYRYGRPFVAPATPGR